MLVDENQIKAKSLEEAKQLEFQEKQIWFRNQINLIRIPWTLGADTLNLSQSNIVEDSLAYVSICNWHKEIKINFENEKINDAGGVLREWSFLMITSLFSEQFNLFSRTETQNLYYKINPECEFNDFTSSLYKLAGISIAKSIFEKITCNCFLNIPFIKKFLNLPITLNDIKFFDQFLFNSLKYIIENDISNDEIITETFSILQKDNQNEKIYIIPLIENGQNIQLNQENKDLYIQCLIEFYTFQQIKKQLSSFLEGFYQVIPKEIISVFKPHEFEMILNGLPFIDVSDWKLNTDYKGEFHSQHEVIIWFWKILQSFTQNQIQKILLFCTGSSRVPVEGFIGLESNRGEKKKFCIESKQFDPKDLLPKGITCFNRLILPLYKSQQMLYQNIEFILNCDFSGVFGIKD